MSEPEEGQVQDRRDALRRSLTVSLKGWRRPVAGPEVAAYPGKDIPARNPIVSGCSGTGPAGALYDAPPFMRHCKLVLTLDPRSRGGR